MKLMPVIFLLMAPLLTNCEEPVKPSDCSDIHQKDKGKHSGVYDIYPAGGMSAVKVYCDMDLDAGGWTVFQRRMDGTLNFYRGWQHYKMGFGDVAGEYWLGLDNIYYMTNTRKYELRVDMEDFEGKTAFARYTSFAISSECDGYTLQVSGFIDGGAGNALDYHNGHKFTTFDKDHDSSDSNCAKLHLGAFWYHLCHHANPNGVYRWGADNNVATVGVEWYQWKGWDYSLKSISMKIRPVK